MRRFCVVLVALFASVFTFSCGSTAPLAEASKTAGAVPSVYHIVLVEATGAGPETESFIARLTSDLSDTGTAVLVDGRLSGATIGDVPGERGKAFKKAWPADAYLGVSIPACDAKTSWTRYSDTTPEGYRVERQISSVTSSCKIEIKLVHDKAGRSGDPEERFSVSGQAVYREGDSESGVAAGDEQALFDAAKKAAKKIASAVKR